MAVTPGSGGAGQGSPNRLRGRKSECAALDGMIAAVRGGESRALVVRGDAGVGKTALLEYAVESASGLRVLRAVGVESEMELPFAALHQLCAPVLDHLERLPAPQREALRIVFGLSAGPPPDRFLVALAVLTLVAEVAGERPLLCVVDDAQWLDQASAGTLGFVARRLRAESVALVFGAREPGDELRGLPEIRVEGLRNGDARALLGSVLAFRLDDRVRDQIVAETRGNPLALLELPRGLSPAQLAGGFGLPGAQALSGRIEDSFLRRLDTLPADARLLLLIAAAEPVGDPLLLWRAAERLGIGVSAAARVETEGLLATGQRVTFRHPLVRSAVYRSASLPERRTVHMALAEVTDPELDPDRRAWHLAAAAPGPDEQVAQELERSAVRAQARGGLGAAAAFLQRSVALTHEPARRTNRALAAAQANVQAGSFDVALGLLVMAEAGTLDDFQRARLDLLRAQTAYSLNRGSDAPPLLLRAAKTLEPLDPTLARETYLDAWSAALFAGQLAKVGGLLDVSLAARAAPRPADAPRSSDLMLDGFALLFTEGRPAAAPLLQRAATAFAGTVASIDEVLRWGWLATAAAAVVWDYEACVAAAARQVQLARDAGALSVLEVGLNVMGQTVVLGGDFGTAASLIAEADAVKEATGSHVAPYGALVLAAYQAREADAFALIDATIADATAGGQGTAVQYARWARSVVLNALGRYPEALGAAQQASDDTPELFVSAWSLSELIEAATKCGKTQLAVDALGRLAENTHTGDADWARGIEARSRAVLSDGGAADDLYLEAIDRLSRARLHPELARARLLYGEWLRRDGRDTQGREQLRAAHDMLIAIGMDGFAERARRELAAIGVKVRRPTAGPRAELTAQEQQIARLARDGLSNPEIGARLFISPRTVEWHLRKVFTKLAVTSRRELRSVLRDSEYVLVPPR